MFNSLYSDRTSSSTAARQTKVQSQPYGDVGEHDFEDDNGEDNDEDNDEDEDNGAVFSLPTN